MHKKAPVKTSQIYKLAILPVVFFGCYLLSFLIDPTREWSHFFDRHPSLIIREVLYTLLSCSILIFLSFSSARFLDKWIPWQKYPGYRFSVQLVFQVVMSILIFYLFFRISLYLSGYGNNVPRFKPYLIRQAFVINIILSILISLIDTGSYFFKQWRTVTKEANELNQNASSLKQIALEAELQSLKMQLDPHFMFNNFSTLSALIVEDKGLAQLFLENLSKVYRYMIINIHKNIVSLEEEMEFANSYFYLMKIRLADNIRMEVSLSEDLLKKGIPPITLQLLIENALKHNIASRKKPLIIIIEGDKDNNLVVRNSLQRLNYNIPSTKMGLMNIQSRYNLLTQEKPIIVEDEAEFRVTLPLINLLQE